MGVCTWAGSQWQLHYISHQESLKVIPSVFLGQKLTFPERETSTTLSSYVLGSKQRPTRNQGLSKQQKICVSRGCVLEYVRCMYVKHNELKVRRSMYVCMYETGSGIAPLWPHFAVKGMFLEWHSGLKVQKVQAECGFIPWCHRQIPSVAHLKASPGVPTIGDNTTLPSTKISYHKQQPRAFTSHRLLSPSSTTRWGDQVILIIL